MGLNRQDFDGADPVRGLFFMVAFLSKLITSVPSFCLEPAHDKANARIVESDVAAKGLP